MHFLQTLQQGTHLQQPVHMEQDEVLIHIHIVMCDKLQHQQETLLPRKLYNSEENKTQLSSKIPFLQHPKRTDLNLLLCYTLRESRTLAARCRFFISSSSRRISRTTHPSNLSVILQTSPNDAPCTNHNYKSDMHPGSMAIVQVAAGMYIN